MKSEVKVFGVRSDILKALMQDPEWRAMLEKAQNNQERREVINAFARSKGYKISSVEI